MSLNSRFTKLWRPLVRYIGPKTCKDPQILREGVQTTCLQVTVYVGEIHEAIQKARPQFQAHEHTVSIKNTSRTALCTVLLLAYGYEATTDSDPMAKLAEKVME